MERAKSYVSRAKKASTNRFAEFAYKPKREAGPLWSPDEYLFSVRRDSTGGQYLEGVRDWAHGAGQGHQHDGELCESDQEVCRFLQ
jgi:hypothetical protein